MRIEAGGGAIRWRRHGSRGCEWSDWNQYNRREFARVLECRRCNGYGRGRRDCSACAIES